MKKIHMKSLMLVFCLTIFSQIANSMAENSSLSPNYTPEETPCSIEIEAEVFCGSVVFGSTLNAPNYQNVPVCLSFNTEFNNAGGMWYELVGEGNNVIVSTCNPGTNFDTQVAVFRGDGCEIEDLDCVVGNDDWEFSNIDPYFCNYDSITSTLQFEALEGFHYFIFVTGYSFQDGNFELTVTSNNAPLSISCPGNMNRSTNNSNCEYIAENGEFDPTITANCFCYK